MCDKEYLKFLKRRVCAGILRKKKRKRQRTSNKIKAARNDLQRPPERDSTVQRHVKVTDYILMRVSALLLL